MIKKTKYILFAILCVIALLAMVTGCETTKTVTVAEITQTQWTSAVTVTADGVVTTVTLPAVTNTINNTVTNTVTAPAVTETSTITLPQATYTTTEYIEVTPTTSPPPTSTITATLSNSVAISVVNYITGSATGMLSLKEGATNADLYVSIILNNSSNVTFSNVKLQMGFILNLLELDAGAVTNMLMPTDTSGWVGVSSGDANILTKIPNINVAPGKTEFLFRISVTFTELAEDINIPYTVFGGIS